MGNGSDKTEELRAMYTQRIAELQRSADKKADQLRTTVLRLRHYEELLNKLDK